MCAAGVLESGLLEWVRRKLSGYCMIGCIDSTCGLSTVLLHNTPSVLGTCTLRRCLLEPEDFNITTLGCMSTFILRTNRFHQTIQRSTSLQALSRALDG